jgi:hypothetical protein
VAVNMLFWKRGDEIMKLKRKPCCFCLEKARHEALQHGLKQSMVPAARIEIQMDSGVRLALCQDCCERCFEPVAG